MGKRKYSLDVDKFRNEYQSIQSDGNSIYSEILPLLKRLKALSKKAGRLRELADLSDGLYESFPGDKYDRWTAKGWDVSILSRLGDFDYIADGIESIDNVLHNLKVSRFARKSSAKNSSRKSAIEVNLSEIS